MEGYPWWDFCLVSTFRNCSNSACACRTHSHLGVTCPGGSAGTLAAHPPRLFPGVLLHCTSSAICGAANSTGL